MKPVIVVGAGWSGAVVAHTLTQAGIPVEVLERSPVVGGHSRVEWLNGVMYEPNGPHILHTDNRKVARFLEDLGLFRPYWFRPLTEIIDGRGEPWHMSWPIQVSELEQLPDWPTIEKQLADLPPRPSGDDFESYAVSLMGRRLYELFIEGYTRKQWGMEPSALSSAFAPKRIDLRRDGVRDLFRDGWQSWPASGVNGAIETLLRPVAVTCGADVTAFNFSDVEASAVVVTAALDDFAHAGYALEWRGIHMRSHYAETTISGTITPAYVINRPHMGVTYTRTVETKHASGQRVGGTVVSYEYPGADAKHYPVADLEGRNIALNRRLQQATRDILTPIPTFFCGRLATYRYINQDEAIAEAWACADQVMAAL